MARVEAAGLDVPRGRTASSSTVAVPLSELLWQPIGVRRAAAIVSEILHALATWHERGQIHGHLHPGLIQLGTGRDGVEVVVIMPIETIVCSLENAEWHSAYRAPEQLQGAEASVAGDLHAVGVILYEMLTGHAPAPLEDPTPRLQQHLAAPVPRETKILNPLLAGLADRDPNRRFRSAREALAVLERCLSGEGPAEPAPPVRMEVASATVRPSNTGPSNTVIVASPSLTQPVPETVPARNVVLLSEIHAVPPLEGGEGEDPAVPHARARWISRGASVAALLGVVAFVTAVWMQQTLPGAPVDGGTPILSPAALASPTSGVLPEGAHDDSAAELLDTGASPARASARGRNALPPPPSLASRKDRRKARTDRPKSAVESEPLEVEAPPEPEPEPVEDVARLVPGRQVVMTPDEAEAWSRMRAGTPAIEVPRIRTKKPSG